MRRPVLSYWQSGAHVMVFTMTIRVEAWQTREVCLDG